MSAMAAMPQAAPVSAQAARAHAQRNCLSTILAVASLVAPELSPESVRRIERLRAAAARLSEAVREDVKGGGEDSGGVRDIEIDRLFADVFDALRDRADAAQVSLLVRSRGGRLLAVERELREGLLNLIANALEATPKGRTVVVDTAVDSAGGHVWTIQDSGDGMSKEILDGLGEAFRTFRPGGWGIGVPLANAAIQKLDGTLQFESAPGHGTKVTIVIPPPYGRDPGGPSGPVITPFDRTGV